MRIALAPLFALITAASMALLVVFPAPFAKAHERHAADPRVPECASPLVLREVIKKAKYAEQRQWQDDLVIETIDHVRQTRLTTPREHGIRILGTRDRRWCRGNAHMSDGHTRTVYFLIESRAQVFDQGFGVESCIAGLDRWNVYGGDCRVLQRW